ncbi:MAG TPA: DinB family protein [Bryobacteraceae bacterium]|jgi:uncharacterized damage-inducible protein DinB|nr:DinB family protein [Bryobacteraceae bacterium]
MTISETFLPEFDQEMANTRRILECVPEEKFAWKPHEKSMTLGRLASHVAEMPNWCVVAIKQDKLEFGPNDKPFNAASKSELIAELDKNTAAARDAIAGASDGHLGKTWELFYAGEKILSMPRAAILRGLVMSHMIHHRGQLSVYLRLVDVPIPGMYGPSADMQ